MAKKIIYSYREDDNFNGKLLFTDDETFVRKSFQTFWMKDEADWTKDKQKGRVKL